MGIPRSGPRHSLGGSLLPIPVPVGNFPRLRVPIRGGTREDSPTLENFDTPSLSASMTHVPNTEQVENLLTKPLSSMLFDKLKSKLRAIYNEFHFKKEFRTGLEGVVNGLELASLKTPYLHECQKLKSLRLDAEHIPNLKSLAIDKCPELELSEVLDDQNSKLRLKVLSLRNLPKLVTLPQGLQGYSYSLKNLFISNCSNFEELPEWFPTMTSLNIITIKKCPNLILLSDGMHKLTNLEHLVIRDCSELSKRYKPHDGLYWPLISHINCVTIDDVCIISKKQ
ncbi:hypothetical protein PIB30_027449 [Stylosanthes scabra]|uniref:Uncharacterized protein n=1 Tax=Stylosanthes scabra TaxID=79078 RepID=A0ABU6Y7V2_9FABA|nr:hypothetical protein [Stylosanthes scabra]